MVLLLSLIAPCLTPSLPAQPGPPPDNDGIDLNRPRNLNLRLLPRGRVRLNWVSPRRLNHQRILRADGDGDFRIIENRLPGNLQVYIDPNPGPGNHRYIVEGNGKLRSNPASITVGPRVVRNLACSQMRGELKIHVTWSPENDHRLQVRLDGEPVEGLENLPPNRRRATIDVPPPGPDGRLFLIEVVNAENPGGPAARCETVVEAINLPAIRNLECSRVQGDERKTRLRWDEAGNYEAYEIERNGIVIAHIHSTGWVDEFPPLGIELRYSVAGISPRGHPGPASFCTQELEVADGIALAGRVVFDDSHETPLGRGFVLAFEAGGNEPIARAGIGDDGGFRLFLDDRAEGPFDLEYGAPFHDHVRLGLLDDFDAHEGRADDPPQRFLRASLRGIPTGENDLELRVPLPVIAVSPERSGVGRWQALHDRLRDANEGLLVPIAARGGIVGGSLNLVTEVANIRAHFLRQFGSSPGQVDMIAFGFAGLSARLYAHTSTVFEIRRLLLLGTPNHGTPRALVETRSDVGARPIRGAIRAPEDLDYKAADEQTSRFLELYNERITRSRATTLYLVAGTGGRRELDAVLECSEHDGRVCLQSALGQELDKGIFRAPRRFILASDHENLGRDAESLALMGRLGLGRILGEEEKEEAGNAGDGGGAGIADPSMALGKVDQGELAPGDSRQLPFVSDTSGSIIIILNSTDQGSLDFQLRTPGMDNNTESINSENAAEHGFVYESYNDGEGTNVQYFKTNSGEHGIYLGKLDNPAANPSLKYTVEFRLESSIYLSGELNGYDVPLGSTPLLSTELQESQLLPEGLEITQSARVFFPDGSLSLLDLNDDGEGGDIQAGDGVYSSTLPDNSQPGYYIIEIEAGDPDGLTFQRADTLQLLVRSDLATLGNEYESGADDVEEQGEGGGAGAGTRKDNLWVRGLLEANRGGDLVVLGTLTDLDGNTITQTGSLYTLESASADIPFQLDFDGYEIFGSQANGPYRLADVEVIDAGVGFIRTDLASDVHTTDPYGWSDFSLSGGLLFLRGDTNNDQVVDISDSINLLRHLFIDPDTALTCRDAADANADGAVDLSDAVSIVNFLFLGQGGSIPQPYPECGQNEELGCDYYPYCR